MKVKTLKPHFNGWGDEWGKTAGDEYDLPDEDARPLIKSGKVEEVKDEETKPAPSAGKAGKAGKGGKSGSDAT